MLKVLFTLDYEIHGNGDGDPYALMVEPTERLMQCFAPFDAKLTIMADVAEILKFKEYKETTGRDKFAYEAIIEQLRDAVRRGHDVQLHLHTSYFNAREEDGRWIQDWSEYDFARLGLDRMKEVVRIGKRFLETLLQPVNPDYRCFVFRAANWSVSPPQNVVPALVENGIVIDTSIFKYGRREGVVCFDYRRAPSALVPWRLDENDVSARSETSALFEFPIYAENRFIGAFLTPQRFFRACLGRLHRVAAPKEEQSLPLVAEANHSRPRRSKVGQIFQRHSWKADFNQCNGRQLIRALQRAAEEYDQNNGELPFVLIGHSKLFTRFNQWSLRPFLEFVAGHSQMFGFGKFGDFEFSSSKSRKTAEVTNIKDIRR